MMEKRGLELVTEGFCRMMVVSLLILLLIKDLLIRLTISGARNRPILTISGARNKVEP